MRLDRRPTSAAPAPRRAVSVPPVPAQRRRRAGPRRRVRTNRQPTSNVVPLPRGHWSLDAVAVTTVTALLLVFGLVMSFSASFVEAATAGDPFAVFRRQAVFGVIGGVAFAVIARMPHTWWRRLSWPMITASLVLLLLVLVPGVGIERFGSTRWIGLGPLALQPTEFAKLAVVVWLADVYERKRPTDGAVHDLDHLLVPAVPLLVLLAVLVMLQPDLGTTIILTLIVGALLWVEGLPARLVAVLGSVVATAAVLLAVVAPYRMARISGWLAPEDDPLGSGFQLLQSRYALGSGGVFGVGLGESRGKWNFVPNPETDFIFAIIGEELGLVGTLGVVLLFALLLVFGYRIAFRVPDAFGRTVAFTITTWIVGQALINVGTVTGLLPITGVTLPLVSVGGSSLLVTLVGLGILVSMARTLAPARRRRSTRAKGTS